MRNGDFTRQESASLSNFPGGLQYVQLKINGQGIPANRIETGFHAYEMYRQLAFAYGKQIYSTNNIPVDDSILGSAVAGIYGTTGANLGLAAPGQTTMDTWNQYQAASGAYAATAVNKLQGCTVVVFSLADRKAMSGQNVKGGVAVRGMNVSLEYTLQATQAAYNLNLFAIQDALLILKGTSVATIQ